MDGNQNQLELLHILIQCKDLQSLLDTGRTIYPHPLILCDLTHQVLAITTETDLDHAPWLEIVSTGGIPLDKISEPTTLDCYRRSSELGKGQVQPPKHGEPPMLRRALCSGSKIIGYLDSPCYSSQSFSQLDQSMFDVIADLCNLRMEKDGCYYRAPENMMEFFITDLMEGRISNERLIEERFRYFHWNLRTPLHIISARYTSEDLPSISILQNICQRISSAFPLFTSFVYGNQLKFIVPQSAVSALEHSKIDKLTNLFRKEKLIGGISRPLVSFKEFASYNLQSEKALELGLLLRPEIPLHFYDNMFVFHTLEYCSDQVDTIEFVHSAIYTLAEYDRTHDTNFLETLEIYLRCYMSIPGAANKLSIHRNTMSYRINKIRELTNVSLDNSETVFHLLYSYHILEYYSATIMKDQKEQWERKPYRF